MDLPCSSFPRHFLTELFEKDFFDLVFLQSSDIAAICPREQDRTLRAVAYRAVHSTKRQLSPNWDLDQVNCRIEELLCTPAPSISPLFLRDARDSERVFGRWYLQDGSHRALGYAVAVLTHRTPYSPVNAFCATGNELASIESADPEPCNLQRGGPDG